MQADAQRLAHTINFDQARYGAKVWGDALKPEHFAIARAAGFTAVRLPIDWVHHMQPQAPYRVDPAFFARVDQALAEARAQGLAVVLDNHEDDPLMADPKANRERFLALWQQLATHYRTAGPEVYFEPLAEPHGALTPLWNAYFAQALAVIRRSNPTRSVLVGPTFYNNVSALDQLQLPNDARLIVCVHTYAPVHFTFQGESFLPNGMALKWLGTTWTGTPAERAEVAEVFDQAAAWGKAHDRPIFIEELGSSTHADQASRVRWTAFNREQAESHGMAWGYWAFGPTFALYDLKKRAWNTELLHALLPSAKP